MKADDESGTGVFELLTAAAVGSAAAWSAAQLASAWVAAGAAAAGVLVALAAFGWASHDRRRFRLPRFAVPPFPPVARADLDGVVIPFRRVPRLPAASELDGRVRAHGIGRQQSAEVVPLKADASAALREALTGLKDVRR